MKRTRRVKFKGETIPMLLVSLIFMAIGIGMTCILIDDIIKTGNFAAFTLIFSVPALGFGSVFLTMSSKNIIRFSKGKLTLRYGVEGFCTIIDSKCVTINQRGNDWFSLKLKYIVNGNEKYFTTDYLFDRNELSYLKELKQIKMLYRKDFIVITENFSTEIYTTHLGIPIKYFIEKPYSVLINAMIFFTVVGLLSLIAGIILLIIYKNIILLIIGIGLLTLPNFIIGILYAIKFFGGKN